LPQVRRAQSRGPADADHPLFHAARRIGAGEPGRPADLEAELVHLLRAAVTSRMAADVPLGAFRRIMSIGLRQWAHGY